MTKPASTLDREIQAALGLPPAAVKRFKAKIAAYKREVAKVEESYSDAGHLKMAKARDAIDDAIYKASGELPYQAGSPSHLAPPIVAMQKERDELVRSTWDRAQARGREANQRGREAEIKRLREAEREVQRPYDWMRR